MSRRRLAALGAGLCVTTALPPGPRGAAAAAVSGRRFTVDDLLGLEAFGEVSISPDGRRVVYEQRGPYDTADRFDLSYLGHWSTSVLWRTDLDGPPRRLLVPAEGRGHVLGSWSPSGRRLLIHRLRDERWDSGIVDIVSGRVRWLGLGVEPPIRGETAVWRSDDDLVVVVRADRALPYDISGLAAGVEATAARGRAAREGSQPATTVWGSGAFADLRSFSASVELLQLNLVSGDQTVISRGSAVDIALSPDRRWLAVVDRGSPRPVDPGVPFRPGEHPERRHLAVLDLERAILPDPPAPAPAGASDPVPSVHQWVPDADWDLAPGLLAWSPRGDRLLVWVRDNWGEPTDGRLMTVDPSTRSIAICPLGTLTPDVAAWRDTAFQTVRADWLGRDPVLFARAGQDRMDWFCLGAAGPRRLTAAFHTPPSRAEAVTEDHLLFLADGAAWAVDAQGGIRRLSAETALSAVPLLTHWAPPRLRLNAAPRQAWLAARTADGNLLSIGADGSLARTASVGQGGRALAIGRAVVVDRQRDNGVETLRLHRPDRRPQSLARINLALEMVSFATSSPVLHTGPGDEGLTSWLYRPPLAPVGPAGTLALIVVAYPGAPGVRQDNPAEFNAMANVQLLAAMGYAVLVPTLPRTGVKGPSEGLTDQILSVLDACLAENPDLDGARVGYLGHSFGGYTGLVLATQTRRVSSYVILAGISDIAASWGQFSAFGRANREFGITARRSAGWAEQAQGAVGGPPWSHAEAYMRNSPLFAADQIVAPVLLIHGEQDFIPVGQAETMFTALWRQNKDVELVTYWGEAHTLASPAHIRDLYDRIARWFAETLGPSGSGAAEGPARASQRRTQASRDVAARISDAPPFHRR